MTRSDDTGTLRRSARLPEGSLIGDSPPSEELLRIERAEGTLRPVGELDVSTVSVLAAAIEEDRGGSNVLTLDLSALRFMDSQGLRLLLQTAKDLEDSGEMVLVDPSYAVLRLLRLAGVERQSNLRILTRD